MKKLNVMMLAFLLMLCACKEEGRTQTAPTTTATPNTAPAGTTRTEVAVDTAAVGSESPTIVHGAETLPAETTSGSEVTGAVGATVGSAQPGERISAVTIRIYNDAPEDLVVNVGVDVAALRPYRIRKSSTWLSPVYPFGTPVLVTFTYNGKRVSRSVSAGRCYIIKYVSNTNSYDLLQLSSCG